MEPPLYRTTASQTPGDREPPANDIGSHRRSTRSDHGKATQEVESSPRNPSGVGKSRDSRSSRWGDLQGRRLRQRRADLRDYSDQLLPLQLAAGRRERQVDEKGAEPEAQHAGPAKFPGAFRLNAPVDPQAKLGERESDETFEDLEPADHGEDGGEPGPNVVKRRDQAAKTQ